MYECQLNLNLKVTKNTRRSLDDNKEIQARCYQTGIAEGNINGSPTLKGSTATLNCEATYDDSFSEMKVENGKMAYVNGEENNDDVRVNALFNINIVDQSETPTQYDGPLYVFNQRGQSCKYKDGDARFILKGSIADYREQEINGEIYFFTTSEYNEAECNLNKAENSDKATLNCKVETKTKKFTFISDENTNSKSTIVLEMSDDSVSCSENNDDNTSSSSSSGLSNGAVAGIVIGSVAAALVVGGIVVFAALAVKATGAAAAVATASVASSQAALPTSAISSSKYIV